MQKLSIKELDKVVKGSADSNRIRIINMLRKKKLCVCEIAAVLEITQPSVSRHLKKLKTAGFIEKENEGLWTNYYLYPKNIYAKNFINNLDSWISDDEIFTRDMKKVKKIDREKLCCL